MSGNRIESRNARRAANVARTRRFRRMLIDPAFLFVFCLRARMRHTYNPPRFVTEGEFLVDTSPSSCSPMPVEAGNAIAR